MTDYKPIIENLLEGLEKIKKYSYEKGLKADWMFVNRGLLDLKMELDRVTREKGR